MATPSKKKNTKRRPHRSFRRTRRSDALQPLKLPGYIALTHFVNKTLWGKKRLFVSLTVLYAVLYVLLIGLGSQETYTALTDSVKELNNDVLGGNLTILSQAGVIFLSVANTGLGGTLTEAQQIYAVILILLSWLTTVWLLRSILAGQKVKLRDALYQAGAPIIATFIVVLVFVVQLIPIALAAIGYSAASSTGLLSGGIEAMLFWVAAGLLAILSLFWITSTLFAMIIVTLPGTYPFRALSIAGDMVLGRRVKILLRFVWMAAVIVLAWAAVLIPVILLNMWLTSVWSWFASVPLIPIIVLLVTSATTVWVAAYVYILYRKVVDEDAKHKK